MHMVKAIRQAMYDDGYTVLRQAVPRQAVLDARRRINEWLGQEGMPPDDLPTMRAQTYCPGLGGQPPLKALMHRSLVPDAVEQLIGEGNLLPPGNAQIALRFPRVVDAPKPPHGHLDGIGTGTNGMAVGQFSRGFTLLAVVLLNDLPEPYMGNFTVWPGSHRFFEQFFRERDPSILAQGMPKADLPHPPVQMTGQAGDVVLAHHHLVHGAAPNYSPDIRYAAIFRLKHKDVEANGVDAMSDIWREWQPVRELIEPTQPAASAT
ncbi:MAG: phytanoyl-CoA dioxygenase family protein [Phycisphaeraceae bacterium]